MTSPNILFLVISLNLMRALASATVTAGASETHAEQFPGLAVGKDLPSGRRDEHKGAGHCVTR